MHKDSPDIYATGIMIIINDAWHQSFAQVDFNKKVISDRGWGPLNYNRLDNEDIKATMTNSEHCEYLSKMKLNLNDRTINNSLSEPFMATSTSELTDENGINK